MIKQIILYLLEMVVPPPPLNSLQTIFDFFYEKRVYRGGAAIADIFQEIKSICKRRPFLNVSTINVRIIYE